MINNKVIAAADGSSLGNPGPAGWCWYISDSSWQAGGWENATNNQAELTAVLELLRITAEGGKPLEILCDSQYVINCCTQWMAKWKKNGWRKADRKPVENQDLLRQLDVALQGRKVEFKWVKGHAGHSLNEAADERARAVATAYREGVEPESGPGFQLLEPEKQESEELEVVVGAEILESELKLETAVLDDMEPEDIALVAAKVAEVKPESVETKKIRQDLSKKTTEDILQTLLGFERELLSPPVRSNLEMVRSFLHPEYIAHASNGKIWNLEAGLKAGTQVLGASQLRPLGLIQLGDSYLLRWVSLIDGRKSTRVSLWQRGGIRGWQLRFTQATLEK